MEENSKEFLLNLSRDTILKRLGLPPGRLNSKDGDIPDEVKKDGACFVTLTMNGDLRGCIGTMEARRALYLDVIANSVNAAFNDPRFSPMSKNEISGTKIEISVLSPRKEIDYSDLSDLKKKIIPGKHGVYLSHLYYSATFLPQVWEQLETHEQFFAHLCVKAGLSHDFLLYNHPNVQIYTVENFEEK
jgi:AmmeMemoRadiSam system protein A